jgi:hypothetical protein
MWETYQSKTAEDSGIICFSPLLPQLTTQEKWEKKHGFGFSLDHHIAAKIYIEHVYIHIWNRADIKEMNYADNGIPKIPTVSITVTALQ